MRTDVIHEFLVFSRHLSFSRAAAELHITQPNLSKHMADLEREVGVALIDRKTHGKNRPVLTPAGKFFVEEMSYAESSFLSALKRCRLIGKSGARDVRIQELWQNNAMIMLYALAGSYQSAHPGTTVRYVRLSDRHPIDALLGNEFDVVIDVWCGPYDEHVSHLGQQGVRGVPLITEPLVIWHQAGNRHLAGKTNVHLEDLLGIPVIVTRGGSLDYMAVSYAEYCERHGLAPRLRHMQPSDNSPTGMFMSDFRDGVLMTTPAMAQDPRLKSRPDLHHSIITDERVATTFLLAVRADDREASAFLDYVLREKPPMPNGHEILSNRV